MNRNTKSEDLAMLIIVSLTLLFYFTGLSLCLKSWFGAELLHPIRNFCGILIMVIVPLGFSIIVTIMQNLSGLGPWQYSNLAAIVLSRYLIFAFLTAYYFTGTQTIPTSRMLGWIFCAWILSLSAASALNLRLDQLVQKDKDSG